MNAYTEDNVTEAFEYAKKNQLPVLVDFWSRGCKGCKKMEDVTYQDETVLKYLEENYVFVKYNTANKIHNFRNTYITAPHLWTPCFIVFANDGSEVKKVSGYLPPQQFFDEMELGRAYAYLRKAQSPKSLEVLNRLIEGTSDTYVKQEALYWAGVSAFYAEQKKIEALTPYWERLMDEYPQSVWAERADCLDVELAGF